LCVHSSDRCRMLDALAQRRGSSARVHLNVDTGMGRLGVHPERALELASEIRRMPGLELVGLMTHVAACDGLADARGRAQVERFEKLCEGLTERAPLPPLVHVANSAVLFTAPEASATAAGSTTACPRPRAPRYSGVRPGISAYGLLPPHLPYASVLEPILSLWTRVVFFKDVPRGTPIGYDGTFTTSRESRIATLPIGYHDGMAWRCGNRAEVLVRGRRVPVVGRVSMDYTTIDVTDVPGVTVGDPVVVIGRQGDESIGALEFARNADTIPYEVTCTIGRRVPRVLVHERTADEIVPAVVGARVQR
jgi:alanine racemase